MTESCPLKPSPIAALRRKYGLSRRAAAMRPGMNPRHLAALEMRSAGVPQCTLDAMEALFGNLRRFTQLTIWDAIAALEQEGVCTVRDPRPGRPHVGPVTLLPSPLVLARERRGLSVREAARCVGLSELRLARLETATQRLAPRTQASLIGRLAPPAPVVQLSLFETGLV